MGTPSEEFMALAQKVNELANSGAEDAKESVNGKQIRCWKVPVDNVENKEFNNTTKFKYIPKPLKEPEPY